MTTDYATLMSDIEPKTDALLIVDAQIDFFPGGALAVPYGDKIIPAVNEMIRIAKENNLPIFASRDWHPEDNISFIERSGPFPPHCLQNSKGAEFHPDIHYPDNIMITSKGYESESHPMSPLVGIMDDGKPFLDLLREMGITRLWLGGLCLDYCVRAAALDTVEHGFGGVLIKDATLPLDPSDEQDVLNELTAKGVEIR